jgi:hypothetical protein
VSAGLPLGKDYAGARRLLRALLKDGLPEELVAVAASLVVVLDEEASGRLDEMWRRGEAAT